MNPEESASPGGAPNVADDIRAEFLNLRNAAQQHGRHLDNIVISTLGTTILLASGGVLVVGQQGSLAFGQLGSYGVYLLLFFAFATCLLALAHRAQLVPNPDMVASDECIAERRLRAARYCFENAAAENHHRKSSLMITWGTFTVVALNFALWVTPESQVDGLISDRVAITMIQLLVVAVTAIASITYMIVRMSARSHKEQSELLDNGLVLDLEGRASQRRRGKTQEG